MFCIKCGNKISSRAPFCDACGTATPRFEEALTRKEDLKKYHMKWYYFTIYGQLIANAVGNILNAILYLTGFIYYAFSSPTEMYNYYGMPLKVLDIIFGIACVGIAIFSLIVRGKLHKLKAEAPRYLILFLTITLAMNLVYDTLFLVITRENLFSVSTYFGLMILMIGNYVYYQKRKDIFVR